MSEKMLFSIIIPVYNTGKYLKRCFESVLNQRYKKWEVIVVDDGSSDISTIQLCDDYAKIDNRFKVFHKKNEGALLARIFGLNYAEGEYYCFLDSDDYWNDRLLDKAYEIILNTKCDLILFRFKRLGTRRNTSSPRLFKDKTILTPSERKKILYHLFTDDHLNNLCLKIVKSTLINKEYDLSLFGGIKYGEDFLYSVPILLEAKKIYYLDRTYYYYCNNPESITRRPESEEMFWTRYFNSYKVSKEVLKLLNNYIYDENIYIYLFYKDVFLNRITYAKKYLKWQKDLKKRKQYLNALFFDDLMKSGRKYIVENDYRFQEKRIYKKFQDGQIVDWMIEHADKKIHL